MLTVVIPTMAGDDERLAQTLAVLVRHAVSGAIVEVIVLDGADDGEQRRVAEVAGCRYCRAEAAHLPDLLAQMRGTWVLVLEAGARPVGAWIDAVEDHINAATRASGAARFRIAPDPAANWWRRLWGPRVPARPFARGFLISRAQASALSGDGRPLGALPRGLAVRTLPAALSPRH
ncbi:MULTISPECIES: glycosyl transferase [unclassified Roseitalea]|uniref:glycosyl transferase n=1 Tax=unclassified Roseitalea TaxID=2639107 RepID=UPI00273D4D24|nr:MULTISPECIES: glycosyl transferase [unclassified Roseitalea]